MIVALMTLGPTPSAHIWRPLEHLIGCGERGENGRTYQESFHIMCQGQGLDSKGWRSCKKEVNNKEEKEEPRKRGMIESEKREGEMSNKVEKEKPRKNLKKRAKRAFLDFSEVFPFPLYWPPLRPFFRFGRPSLPWFFLSLFIHHFFLVRSSALAVQALPQAHDMKWFLKGSTISPSLSNQSHPLKFTFKYFWNYFEPIFNLFWINVMFWWNDHVLMILN